MSINNKLTSYQIRGSCGCKKTLLWVKPRQKQLSGDLESLIDIRLESGFKDFRNSSVHIWGKISANRDILGPWLCGRVALLCLKVVATLKQPWEIAKDLKTSLEVASVCVYSVGKLLKKQAFYNRSSQRRLLLTYGSFKRA